MSRKFVAILLVLLTLSFAQLCEADYQEVVRSANWADQLFEENSLWASLLFIPNTTLGCVFKIITNVYNPKPNTHATIPPDAHRAPE